MARTTASGQRRPKARSLCGGEEDLFHRFAPHGSDGLGKRFLHRSPFSMELQVRRLEPGRGDGAESELPFKIISEKLVDQSREVFGEGILGRGPEPEDPDTG